MEHLKKYIISLLGKWLFEAWYEGWIRFSASDQRGWPEELCSLFRQKSQSMLPESEQLQEDIQSWNGITFSECWAALVQDSVLNQDKIATRWCDLDERLHLNYAECALLAILTCIQYDWQLLRALRFATAESSPSYLRWGFLVRFIAPDEKELEEVSSMLLPEKSILFKSGILRLMPHAKGETLAGIGVGLQPQVASYLSGYMDTFDNILPAETDLTFGSLIYRRIVANTGGNRPPRYIIQGAKGSGKVELAQRISGILKCTGGLLLLDLSRQNSVEEFQKSINDANSLATALNAAIALVNIQDIKEQWTDLLKSLVPGLEKSIQPLIWILSGDVPSWIHYEPEGLLTLSMPNRMQRSELWADALETEGRFGMISKKYIEQLSGQFLLTDGQIHQTVRACRTKDYSSDEQYYQALSAHARMLSKEGIGSLATPEPARVPLDQLIVSPECKTALDDLIMYAKHRKELAKEWGFERSMPYGLGLSALFSGPPGTGKTYGAQAIATALKLELYRVDLSQLVSKYIGETEKHLAELFNAAEQGEVLLLFDEADSVFGKRTEVKTSVDRYANLEINYLLQRMERFTGVSILTSNFDSAIDEAFMRRIRFKVPFELPDVEARIVLWKKFLAPQIPLANDVDISYLAETFELSGGHIKEAVLRAASIAYGSAVRVVTQDLLFRSAELEYKKLGKLMLATSEE